MLKAQETCPAEQNLYFLLLKLCWNSDTSFMYNRPRRKKFVCMEKYVCPPARLVLSLKGIYRAQTMVGSLCIRMYKNWE